MRKIKMLIAAMAVGAMGLVGVMATQPAAAEIKCPEGSIRGSDAKVNNLAECNVKEDEEGNSLFEVLTVIINVVLSVLGFATVVMIIMGGVQYLTSSGDPAKATKGKNTIMYGVIGLVIALLAFAIVNFILGNIFNGEQKKEESTGSLQLDIAEING